MHNKNAQVRLLSYHNNPPQLYQKNVLKSPLGVMGYKRKILLGQEPERCLEAPDHVIVISLIYLQNDKHVVYVSQL